MKAMSAVVVLVLQVLGDKLEAVRAAGHGGRVVDVDPGHAVVAAERLVPRGEVEQSTGFVRGVVPLRSLVHHGRGVKAFWRVVGPPPWVAEGELRVASRASRLLALIIVRSSLLGPGVDT